MTGKLLPASEPTGGIFLSQSGLPAHPSLMLTLGSHRVKLGVMVRLVASFRLATRSFRRMSLLFFEKRWTGGPSSPQPGVREPRENRGRLRHCNGLQTPRATDPAGGIGKAGARSQARSQDTGLAVLVPVVDVGQRAMCCRNCSRPTSPSKRRMRPALCVSAQWDSLNAFILRFAGV